MVQGEGRRAQSKVNLSSASASVQSTTAVETGGVCKVCGCVALASY